LENLLQFRVARAQTRPRNALCHSALYWSISSVRIKCPKTAVATSGSVKLQVQIEHAFGFQIDDAQIRISILSRATPVPIAASRGPALPIVSTMRSAPRSATLASIAAKVSFSFGYGFCLSRPGRPLKE
jgi:hypothetical protein